LICFSSELLSCDISKDEQWNCLVENLKSEDKTEEIAKAMQCREKGVNPCSKTGGNYGHICTVCGICAEELKKATPKDMNITTHNYTYTPLEQWLNVPVENNFPLGSNQWYILPIFLVICVIIIDFASHKRDRLPSHFFWTCVVSLIVVSIWKSVENQYKFDLVKNAAELKYFEAQFMEECELGRSSETILDSLKRYVTGGFKPVYTSKGELSDHCKGLIQQYENHAASILEAGVGVFGKAIGRGFQNFFTRMDIGVTVTLVVVIISIMKFGLPPMIGSSGNDNKIIALRLEKIERMLDEIKVQIAVKK